MSSTIPERRCQPTSNFSPFYSFFFHKCKLHALVYRYGTYRTAIAYSCLTLRSHCHSRDCFVQPANEHLPADPKAARLSINLRSRGLKSRRVLGWL